MVASTGSATENEVVTELVEVTGCITGGSATLSLRTGDFAILCEIQQIFTYIRISIIAAFS